MSWCADPEAGASLFHLKLVRRLHGNGVALLQAPADAAWQTRELVSLDDRGARSAWASPASRPLCSRRRQRVVASAASSVCSSGTVGRPMTCSSVRLLSNSQPTADLASGSASIFATNSGRPALSQCGEVCIFGEVLHGDLPAVLARRQVGVFLPGETRIARGGPYDAELHGHRGGRRVVLAIPAVAQQDVGPPAGGGHFFGGPMLRGQQKGIGVCLQDACPVARVTRILPKAARTCSPLVVPRCWGNPLSGGAWVLSLSGRFRRAIPIRVVRTGIARTRIG